MSRTILVEPTYDAFLGDQLFEAAGTSLDRDNALAPFRRLRTAVEARGGHIHTHDHWGGGPADYYSLGETRFLRTPHAGVRPRAFLLFEPPVVMPRTYAALPRLTRTFEAVYVYNTEGHGYSLRGVDRSRLRVLRFPQPTRGVLPQWSRRERQRKLVVINGNKRPWSREGELYSERIRAIAELEPRDAVDLYGQGWNRVLLGHRRTLRQFFWPQLRHYRALQRVYRGPVASKHDTLARYDVALCLENCVMRGYVTEKVFDCLYAGTVPLYLGAPDIAEILPRRCYIDARAFSSWTEAWDAVRGLSRDELDEHRAAGKDYLDGPRFRAFHDALLDIFGVPAAD